jgi:hypothetical protein
MLPSGKGADVERGVRKGQPSTPIAAFAATGMIKTLED